MKNVLGLCAASLLLGSVGFAGELLQSIQTPYGMDDQNAIVLKNDSFKDEGGQAYLQLGFVEGEKAGIYVKVPEHIQYFKVDYFRVLIGNATVDVPAQNTTVFFQMGIAKQPSPASPREIENAASITPGPYWNDIPAQGTQGGLRCATGGEFIGAGLEFTHSGAPSVYRDLDGQSDITRNSIYAIPGGWKYSIQFGVRGDWILRVVGHEADASECE